MIILDTNIISEAMQPVPAPEVLRWLDQLRPEDQFFLTTITIAEILYGIEILPKGKRRDKLLAETEDMFTEEFEGRFLGFDEEAAHAFTQIAAMRRSQGRPITEFDAQIAAIARSRGAALATLNTADFEGCGLRLISPWQIS
jgi:predicted nucleic acid-binding protein